MTLRDIAIPELPERAGKEFDSAVKERLETLSPAKLPIYTVQELAAVKPQAYAGWLVRCSNGDAGVECLAYCDGRAWWALTLGDRISIA